MKIIDIFLYNGEKELLDLRLNILNEVVDFFVPIELPHTFSGKPKPFYLNHKDDFCKPFADKILTICGPNLFSEFIWANEWFARNLGGIVVIEKAKPDDIIMLSDIDEIPNPETLKEILPTVGVPVTLNQFYNFYKFNLLCYSHNNGIWPGTVVTKSKHINYPTRTIKEWFSKDFGLQQIRENRAKYSKIENGGNHYSYCYSTEEIQRKLTSFCHAPELDKPEFNNPKHIQSCIDKGESIWVESDGNRLKKIELDKNNTPEYILNNLDKFKHLIL